MPLGILLAAAWVEVLSPAEIAAEIERSLDFLETDRRDAPVRQREAMEEIDQEIENARLAWLWAVDHGQIDRLTKGIGALNLYYTWRVRFVEGETALRAAVQGLEAIAGADPGTQLLLPRALTLWGGFLIEQGRREPGIEAVRRALALTDELEAAGHDVRAERALALHCLAIIKRYFSPDPRDAEDLYRQAIALFEQVGDRRGMAGAMLDLGVIAWVQGHLDEAMPLLEQSAGIYRSLDDWSGLSWTIKSLGELLVRRGLFDDGLIVLESGIQICDELGDQFGAGDQLPFAAEARLHLGHYAEALADTEQVAAALPRFPYRWTRAFAQFIHGLAVLALGTSDEALALLQESAAGFEEIRHGKNRGWVAGPLGLAAHLAGDEDLARQEVRGALQTGVDMGVFMPLMYALPVAARLLADRGDVERAVEVYACAAHSGFVANSRWFQDLVGAPIEAAVAHLPQETLAAARERGQAQTWDEMARQVLAEL
jgi:Tetratricopeptide repeat